MKYIEGKNSGIDKWKERNKEASLQLDRGCRQHYCRGSLMHVKACPIEINDHQYLVVFPSMKKGDIFPHSVVIDVNTCH